MSISDGLGSRKLEVLADTTVTLEQGNNGMVATEIIKRMLKVTQLLHSFGGTVVDFFTHTHTHTYTPLQTVAHTSDRVTHSLEQHFLWSELTVLARFLLALSFNNKINGKL